MTLHRRRYSIGLVVLTWLGLPLSAGAQLGQVTATIGESTLRDAQGNEQPCTLRLDVEEDYSIVTEKDGYVMVYFVSGIGEAELPFDGVIVVEVDQDTELTVRRGKGRRLMSPIDIHVTRGAARAFFDAREHGASIQLSTPLANMRVTGSEIYVTHDLGDQPGSVFGTFDSPCDVFVEGKPRSEGIEITSLQKVVILPEAEPDVQLMTQADSRYWEERPDLFMAAALNSRDTVSTEYASRTWVDEYVTSAQRLEDVAAERSSNIPTQEPVVNTVTTPVLSRAIAQAASAQLASQPRLRSVRENRRIGDDGEGRMVVDPNTLLTVEREVLRKAPVVRRPVRHRSPARRVRGVGRRR